MVLLAGGGFWAYQYFNKPYVPSDYENTTLVYNEAKQVFNRTNLSRDEAVDDAMQTLLSWQNTEGGKEIPPELFTSLLAKGRDFLSMSHFYEMPDLPKEFDTEGMFWCRKTLKALIPVWQDVDTNRLKIKVTLAEIYFPILNSLPPSFFAEDEEDEEGNVIVSGEITFQLPALETLSNIDDLIIDAAVVTHDKELREKGLFNYYRSTVNTNYQTIIDTHKIPPRHQGGSLKSLSGVIPTRELNSCLLSNTPFDGLFNFTVPVVLDRENRFKHQYILGKTGSGKSVLLRYQLAHDIHAGHGVVVMTPERGLIEDALSYVPPERHKDVVYFDTSDDHAPVMGFNPFLMHDSTPLTQKAGELEAILVRTLGDMGVKMMPVISNTIYALLQTGGSFADIPKLLDPQDETYRNNISGQLDPRTQKFFEKYNTSRYYKEVYEPILNRLDTLLRPPLCYTLTESSLNFSELLNNRSSIVLCDMSRLRGFQASITGQLLVSTFQQTFFQRDVIPESQRIPYFFYMDEFQTYATSSEESLRDFLTRARKYQCGIVMAHQNIKDVPETLRASIFGNCGTLCGMLMSADDAKTFTKEAQLSNFDDFKDTHGARAFSQLQNFKPGQVAITTPDMKKARIVQVPEYPPFDRDFDGIGDLKNISKVALAGNHSQSPPPQNQPSSDTVPEPESYSMGNKST